MALDSTVKGTAANSYMTEAEANTYLTTERLYITAWTGATTPNREAALIWATFLIDNNFDFEGTKTTREQSLKWPRIGAEDDDDYDYDSSVIPSTVKKATATLALDLLTNNRVTEPTLIGLGIDEARVGPIQVKINQNSAKDLIPDEVKTILNDIGTPKAGASATSATVKLLRG